MGLVARAAIPGKGFDTNSKVSASQALRLFELGYHWCARYVKLPGNNPAHDIDAAELEALAQVGIDVLLVQHVRIPPWNPIEHSAFADAMSAVDHARGAGYPDGCHIFVDAEGIAVGVTSAECVDYYDRWAAQVRGEGYRVGFYNGYDVPMSPQEKWLLHNVDSYWKDAGPREVANRGFAVQQFSPQKVVATLTIDDDEIVADLLGDTPVVASWV